MIEAIAVITTLWCVYLTKKERILAWPIGIVSSIAYFYIFLNEKLYSDMTLQVFYVIQGLYGWYNWNKPKVFLKIKDAPFPAFWVDLILTFGVGIIIGYLLGRFTNTTQPYLDAWVACFSLLANWYLINKIVQSWLIWVCVDVLLVGIFISRGLWFSAILYFILFLLALQGYRTWQKNIRTD